jgi:hypothetical protein
MITINRLGISDRELINNYLERYPPEISEHTFTNLFVWRKFRPVYFIEKEGSLLIFIRRENDREQEIILFGPPAGEIAIDDILKSKEFRLTGATRLTESTLKDYRKNGISLEDDRDNSDYLYRVSDLADLSGRKYSRKRNHIKRCLDAYECVYEEMSEETLNEVREMHERWCRLRACFDDPDLMKEYEAVREALDNYSLLELTGGIIRINGQVEAFAMAEKLSPGTAVWHFEKAMREFHGLSQLITHWFAKYSLNDFEYVNREQDLGIPGLRKAKLSYFPAFILNKYNAVFTGCKPIPRCMVHFCED